MEINGSTRLVGVIGHPLIYTISPQIHNAAFDALRLNMRYVPMVVEPGGLNRAIGGLDALNFVGVNVTMPHKESVASLLDELDPEAEAIGAVNTIAFSGGKKLGYNTDARGFMSALAEVGFAAQGARVVVIGTGGAARAVIVGLISAGADVVVVNRTKERGERLVETVRDRFLKPRIKVMEFGDESADRVKNAGLVVNATPVGMGDLADQAPISPDLLGPGQLVFDLIYEPSETFLLHRAAQRGAQALGGLSMLIHQAAAAFEIWTGIPAPTAVMTEAAARALNPGQ